MRAPRVHPWSLLRSRRYALLWTAQLASLLGDSFNSVAVAWLVLQLTGSSLLLGTVLAVGGLPRAILMLFGGAVTDHLSPRLTMLISCLARALVMAVLATLVLTHTVQLWQLFASSALLGLVSAFFWPARAAMLPNLVQDEQLEAGNALSTLSAEAAGVLGPTAAGLLVAALGAGTAIAGDAAAFVLAAVLVMPLPAAGRIEKTGSGLLGLVWEGIVYAWRDVPLRAALAVVAVVNFFMSAVNVGVPALAHERFGLGAAALDD